MKLGLLICDHVSAELEADFGNYQSMFHCALKRAAKAISLELEIIDYWVIDEQFPSCIDECDAYLATGSQYSVNDNFPWVLQLKQWVKDLYQHQKPYLGICYGHQMIAAALDGEVEVSDKGWGVGVTQIKIIGNRPEFNALHGQLSLRVSHKEQVVRLPSNTEIIGTSQFCDFFMMQTGKCFLGIQGHPEFSAGYARGLIDSRRGIIPNETVEAGIKSLTTPVDNELIIEIALGFLDKSK